MSELNVTACIFVGHMHAYDTLIRSGQREGNSADSIARRHFLASVYAASEMSVNIAGLSTNKARTWWNFEFSAAIRSIFGRSLSVEFSTLLESPDFKRRKLAVRPSYKCQKCSPTRYICIINL